MARHTAGADQPSVRVRTATEPSAPRSIFSMLLSCFVCLESRDAATAVDRTDRSLDPRPLLEYSFETMMDPSCYANCQLSTNSKPCRASSCSAGVLLSLWCDAMFASCREEQPAGLPNEEHSHEEMKSSDKMRQARSTTARSRNKNCQSSNRDRGARSPRLEVVFARVRGPSFSHFHPVVDEQGHVRSPGTVHSTLLPSAPSKNDAWMGIWRRWRLRSPASL